MAARCRPTRPVRWSMCIDEEAQGHRLPERQRRRLMKIRRDNSAFHGWQARRAGSMITSMAGGHLPTKQNLSPLHQPRSSSWHGPPRQQPTCVSASKSRCTSPTVNWLTQGGKPVLVEKSASGPIFFAFFQGADMGMWIELGIFVLVIFFALHQIRDVRREQAKRAREREEGGQGG